MNQVNQVIATWRTTRTGHLPQMTSTMVTQKYWGWGGAILGKLVPCSSIPQALLYNPAGSNGPTNNVTDWASNVTAYASQARGERGLFTPTLTRHAAPETPPAPPRSTRRGGTAQKRLRLSTRPLNSDSCLITRKHAALRGHHGFKTATPYTWNGPTICLACTH